MIFKRGIIYNEHPEWQSIVYMPDGKLVPISEMKNNYNGMLNPSNPEVREYQKAILVEFTERYPDADIVFMTPLHRAVEEQPGKLPLSGYVAIIREVAAYYALPVLDLYTVSGIQPKVKIMREKFMPDGRHPNDAGAEKIADRLGNFLLNL